MKRTIVKYVVYAPKNLILTLRGFKDANHLNDNQVRLFNHPSHARLFIEESKYCNCKGLFIKKILITMEDFDDENMAL